MTSSEELERTLLDNDLVGTEEKTAAESMPKVLPDLGKTLVTTS